MIHFFLNFILFQSKMKLLNFKRNCSTSDLKRFKPDSIGFVECLVRLNEKRFGFCCFDGQRRERKKPKAISLFAIWFTSFLSTLTSSVQIKLVAILQTEFQTESVFFCSAKNKKSLNFNYFEQSGEIKLVYRRFIEIAPLPSEWINNTDRCGTINAKHMNGKIENW